MEVGKALIGLRRERELLSQVIVSLERLEADRQRHTDELHPRKMGRPVGSKNKSKTESLIQ